MTEHDDLPGPRPRRAAQASRRSASTAAALGLLGVVSGCNQGGTNVRQPVFERPGQLAFACFDAQDQRTPVPLERCSRATGDDAEGADLLHALVTQTAPGEVASVDLRTENDGEVLDLDRRVPGFTHLPVGAQPSALGVPQSAPETTIVASFGSRELLAVATQRFRPEAAAMGLPVQRVVDRLVLSSPPTDLLIDETGDEPRVLVTLPGSGSLLAIPLVEVEGGDGVVRLGFGPASQIPLATTASPPVTADPDDLPDYCVSSPMPCDELDPVPAVPAREPVSLGDEPSPRALTMDDEGRIYVADGSLPIIHVIDGGAGGADDPIPVAVPTTEVVVTPRVPPTTDDPTPTERFLYAVDATDGSVLAVDVEARALVPISDDPISARDRLDTIGAALVLEVATPSYDVDDLVFCSPQDTPDIFDELTPRRTRGVILAVGSTNGDVRFYDVFDLDAPCRGLEDDDDFVAIRRHRPRAGDFTDDPVEVTGDPRVQEEDRTTLVDDDGLPRSGDALAFVPFAEGCPEFTFQVYPDPISEDPMPPVLCARADPFVTGGESWELAWETPLPGSDGGRGLLPEMVDGDGRAVFQAPNPVPGPGGERSSELLFCGLGVLGSDDVADVPDTDPLADYPGDLLVVVGPLPARTENDPVCRERFRLPDADADFEDEIREIAFPIVEAFDDRLVIEGSTRADGAAGPFTLEDVRECFPNPVRYRVEVRGSFRVFGGRTRFRHPVVTGPDGGCEVDPTRPLDRGRAFLGDPEDGGRRFDNGQVVFQLARARTLEPDETVIVDWTIGGYAPKMRRELGRNGVPSDLRWLGEAGLFYIVDQSLEQLLEIDFADQTRQRQGGVVVVDGNRIFN